MSDFVDQLRDVAAASLFPEAGEFIAPGLVEPVEVLRDAWGVPYITAASLEDLWSRRASSRRVNACSSSTCCGRAPAGRGLPPW